MWVWSIETDLMNQDFNSAIVPYRHNPEAYELSSEGIPSYLVDESLTLGHDAWQLDGFLRSVASQLFTDHEVWMEITFEEGDDKTPFKVFAVNGVRQTAAGDLIQELPSRDVLPDWYTNEEEWERTHELDPDRMVHAVLPVEYPSRLLMQVVRGLAEIDSTLLPSWAMDQWSGQQLDKPPYDAGEAVRTHHLRVAQAALPLGWISLQDPRWVRRTG